MRNLDEARLLGDVIRGTRTHDDFSRSFGHKCSEGFDPGRDLVRVGVVNQTTMLATETHEIAQELKRALVDRYGADVIDHHFADTSDTLCYATIENQNATYALVEHGADLAIVVGGHNSSNTSHIVELCERAMPTYFVQSADDVLSAHAIRHFSLACRAVITSEGWMPAAQPVTIVLTCGASCPDAILDGVLQKLLSMVPGARPIDEVLAGFPEVEAV